MKEKIAKVMRSGGYAVIIASIAMAAYLMVLRLGDKFMENQRVPLKILIDDDGYMTTNYGGDTKGIYILWQVDGGNIQPVEKNENLKEQYYDDNKWYFAYTHVTEKVKWEELDADGNRYTKATVRATLYCPKKESIYAIDYYVSDSSITVEKADKKTTACENRLFSNPVREGNDTSWSQIYEVSAASSETKTYMYRTGQTIEKPENKILIWQSNEQILNETDLTGGTIKQFSVNSNNSGKDFMPGAISITYNPVNASEGFELEAYLTYDSNVEKKAQDITDKEKFYTAKIE